ncbi:MarR family transcriptional regulator [Kineosporia sp. NBRC 101677]|uniref:GNAT family N-acetyltransferase n=1 Tax=Kineosporia sp. NBRC 101677 TaxID=3032197 RepID=UPI0024A45633|nr:GNAT family N-acetyltransferase [Kineosporia sp. NBRC 101677]GLY19884.1 MarR family transcriptional regulator [Kineosporia sp. NBRC 101677]
MTPQDSRSVALRRADRPGDLGWVLMVHGEGYHEQFDWDTRFEALVARVVADFANTPDASRQAGWIAEVDGQRAGCIFLMADENPDTAKLRLLYVSPTARGLGVGTQLVHEYLSFARAIGYRSIRLWTVDALSSARKIYAKAGFSLRSQEDGSSFGKALVSEDWTLDLRDHDNGQELR